LIVELQACNALWPGHATLCGSTRSVLSHAMVALLLCVSDLASQNAG